MTVYMKRHEELEKHIYNEKVFHLEGSYQKPTERPATKTIARVIFSKQCFLQHLDPSAVHFHLEMLIRTTIENFQ